MLLHLPRRAMRGMLVSNCSTVPSVVSILNTRAWISKVPLRTRSEPRMHISSSFFLYQPRCFSDSTSATASPPPHPLDDDFVEVDHTQSGDVETLEENSEVLESVAQLQRESLAVPGVLDIFNSLAETSHGAEWFMENFDGSDWYHAGKVLLYRSAKERNAAYAEAGSDAISVAALMDDPDGAYELAKRARDEEPEFALHLLRDNAYKLKHVRSIVKLASCHLDGELGAPIDVKEAKKLFKYAAKRDHPLAQYNLAQIYARLPPSPEAEQKVIYWMKRAADNGEIVAAFNTGMAYHYGQLGLEQDEEKCEHYMQLSADGGNAVAMVFLSGMYNEWVAEAVERGDSFNAARFSARQQKWEKLVKLVQSDEELMGLALEKLGKYDNDLPGDVRTGKDGEVRTLLTHTTSDEQRRLERKSKKRLQRALRDLKQQERSEVDS